MDNFFIAQWFNWTPQRSTSKRVEFINSLLAKLGFWTRLQAPKLGGGEMTNIEPRMNLYHFVSQVLAYQIPGDLKPGRVSFIYSAEMSHGFFRKL
jgi:O-methyltransferase